MKKLLFIFALILVAITSNAQSSPKGDLDNDGVVSVSDVMELVGIILNGGATQSYLTCPDNHHPHMIDLGLPSGTKWACCNVGADKPTAYGGYYAWGETYEKMYYDLPHYFDGDWDTCPDFGEDISGTEYDVAHVRWGGLWVMPSDDHQMELENNCTYEWTTVNGVKGGKFTGKNGGSIFLPAAGRRDESGLNDAGSVGYYWLSMQPFWGAPVLAESLSFESGDMGSNTGYCTDGQSVRPVAANMQNIDLAGDLDGDGAVSVSDVMELVKIILYGDVPPSYLTCPDDHHPHLIDLGLPSGTKWACCNVADDPTMQSPTNEGGYYAWGETEEKEFYDEDTYLYCYSSSDYLNFGSDISDTLHDVAHERWGGSWAMPSKEQQEELIRNCTYKWTEKNGLWGWLFTGANGGSIFLPGTAAIWGDEHNDGAGGDYWSSTQDSSNADRAYCLGFNINGGEASISNRPRFMGQTVRPVVSVQQPSSTCPDNHHPHMIDLGLPSGTKWACCNVADDPTTQSPTNEGGHYAWGETEEKDEYNEVTYLYCTGEGSNWMGIYEQNTQYQYIGYDISGTQYDVAHVRWGGSWTMPSKEQQEELIRNCTCKMMEGGYLFTGANGGSILLPYAASMWGDMITEGEGGAYWSSTLDSSNAEDACILGFSFYYYNLYMKSRGRSMGLVVRPVVSIPKPSSTCPDNHHPHMIDLGLPSGTKWACCNEGASKPEDFGGYYHFGDVSSAPSLDQIKELVNKCSYSWTTLNGVRGGRFTGPNGNIIFLPAAGGIIYFELDDVGSCGCYWSSTPEDDGFFFNLQFNSSKAWWDSGWSGVSNFEYSVRPVR